MSSSSSSSSCCSSPDLYLLNIPHARSPSSHSLPNPHFLKLQQHLNKLMNSSPFPSMAPQPLSYIHSKLLGLCNVYSSIRHLISHPSTQQSLLHHDHGRLVEQALDVSVIFLTTVSAVRDLTSRMMDHLRDFLSALRRRSNIGPTTGHDERQSYINAYMRFRKSSNKEITDGIQELDNIMNKINKYDIATVMDGDEDPHLGKMAMVLKEVAATTAEILQSLLKSFSTLPAKTNKAKRQVRIFMSKMGFFDESRPLEEQIVINEIGSMDMAVWSSPKMTSYNLETIQLRMRTHEAGLQRIESSLDEVSRCLVQYRVSFLINMLAN